MTGSIRRRALRRLPRTASLRDALGGRLPAAGSRIGVLGGSFNPAHEAHLQISRAALRRLNLNAVWWLVSPQNPLKGTEGMASLAQRLKKAQKIAAADPILVSDIEALFATRYSVDSCQTLVQSFPKVHFVWIMGADNLIQVDQWSRWQDLFNTLPVAIFDRPTYSLGAVASKAARRFEDSRVSEPAVRSLVWREPPAWAFLRDRLNPMSATQIRADEVSGEG
ncbi:MAG: nicotinate-nucleotide adenylyltransferase [Pseudomonadota bacterium]